MNLLFKRNFAYFIGVILNFSKVEWTVGLEPLENFEEGPCALNTLPPVKVDRYFVDSLRYLPIGCKYHFYFPARFLFSDEAYNNYPESDFYYDGCPSHNISHTAPIGAIFSAGRVLFTGAVSTPPGLWVEGEILQGNFGSIQHRVTLTDHKTFAFLTNCLTLNGVRTWNVVSLTPEISPQTTRLIEEHAVAQGFKRQNFVHFRYDSCEKGLGNPLLE